MNHFIDAWLSPGVWLLAGWSLRWGIFIVLVAFWFAVRRPRHAATRDAVWRTVLVAGLLLLPGGAGLVVLIKPSARGAAGDTHDRRHETRKARIRGRSSVHVCRAR